MNREEKISLYGYIEDLYQAMQIGSITFEPKHSSELYDLISKVLKENQKLKKRIEEHIKAEMKMEDELKKIEEQDYTVIPNSEIKLVIDKYKNQQKEFIEYLEKEKDRLAKETSHIYEDEIGKVRLVNENIFEEVNEILIKYKEIIGVEDEEINVL